MVCSKANGSTCLLCRSKQEIVERTTNYCYYYYHRKKRFRWHDVKRLQGHLTNTKQNSTSVTQQNEQKYLSDTDGGRANNVVEQEKFNREMFCVHTNLFHRAVLCSYLPMFIKQLNSRCTFIKLLC